jgi:hypothetical protein
MSNINGYEEAQKIDALISEVVEKVSETPNLEDAMELFRFARTIETTCIIIQSIAESVMKGADE